MRSPNSLGINPTKAGASCFPLAANKENDRYSRMYPDERRQILTLAGDLEADTTLN